MTEETSQSPAAIAVPLLASLFVTGASAFLLCTPPPARSLTWPGLLGHALLFVAIAAVSHALAVWLACRVFRDQIDTPARPLIYGLWMATAWLPLLSLLFPGALALARSRPARHRDLRDVLPAKVEAVS